MSKRPPGKTTQAPNGGRMTKAERREAARRERQELIRKAALRRKRRRVGVIVGAIVVAGAIVAAVALSAGGSSSKSTKTEHQALPGMLTTDAPWPANTAQTLERADKIGLPGVGQEIFHHHDLVQIYIFGKTTPVPADIGLTSSGGASIHTHDGTGVVHLETDSKYDFTLGQFFDVWGVRFTPSCIGGYCNAGDKQLRVFVNGDPVTGDPRSVPLGQHDDVVVTYGTKGQLPDPIPADYSGSISSVCAPSC